MTVEAAQKMGELLLQIQKQSGARTDLRTSADNMAEVKTKEKVISDIGIERHQALDYQQMAQGKRTDLETSVTDGTEVKTKTQITEDMGLSHKQTVEYQQMAQNPEAERQERQEQDSPLYPQKAFWRQSRR